jgi:hypothetical protein
MFVTALFGDVFVWAIYGTKFVFSPQFHKMQPAFSGGGVILLFAFIAQAKTDRRLGRTHLVLLAFVALVAAGLPFAPLCANLLFPNSAGGTGPPVLSLALVVVGAAVCKWKALINFWRIIRSIYEPQDTRRIIISK